jgi:hypothetical protein
MLLIFFINAVLICYFNSKISEPCNIFKRFIAYLYVVILFCILFTRPEGTCTYFCEHSLLNQSPCWQQITWILEIISVKFSYLIAQWTFKDKQVSCVNYRAFCSKHVIACPELTKKHVKVKQSHYWPGRAQRVPGGRHMKVVGCQPYAPAAFNPQEIFLVLISVRGWVDPRTIVRPEGLCQWKNPLTRSGIEPTTCRFVAAAPPRPPCMMWN